MQLKQIFDEKDMHKEYDYLVYLDSFRWTIIYVNYNKKIKFMEAEGDVHDFVEFKEIYEIPNRN